MTGPHDLGGKPGFGPIETEPNEPPFHHDWERKIFALTLAMGATRQWNIDTSRHARERIPHEDYLASSYYQIWLRALETLLLEKGLVSAEELASGQSGEGPSKTLTPLSADKVAAALAAGGPADRSAEKPAGFAIGDHVTVRPPRASGHTRIPTYIAGKTGKIARIHGVHVFPDKSADGDTEAAEWLYSVAFDADAVWGTRDGRHGKIMLDLWEPYLDPA